jgi:DNA-binding GntR family transcriptional regulator
VDACGKNLLTEWYRRLNVQAQIVRLAIWNIGPRGDKTYKEHRAIIEAMANNDQKTVRKAIKVHLDSIVSDFEKAIHQNENRLGEQEERKLPHGRRQLKIKNRIG